MNTYRLLMGLGLLLLVGCDHRGPQGSQVIATVGGDEITVHQLKFATSQDPMKVLGESDRIALTEQLIDRQLMAQQALANKLDRQPEFVMRLEEARVQMLAAAYAEHVARRNPPTRDIGEDVAKYHSAHPALFEQRRVYTLREITIPADSPALPGAQERLQRKEDLESVIRWLKQQPGLFSDQLSVRPAENLPVEVADKLLAVKTGETIAFRLPRALVVYQVRSAESSPRKWNAAKPMIERYLKAEREKALVQTELKRLRAAAQISRLQASSSAQ